MDAKVIPPIVSEFIGKINMEGVKYSFAVVTGGKKRYHHPKVSTSDIINLK